MNTSQPISAKRGSFLLQIIPVVLCFFAMGFVDLVGTASNYVQKEHNLTDSEANILPSLVFFWFLIFSVPTGMLMNKIGRKQTVLISLVVTLVSLVIPLFGDSYLVMLVAFSLLGIGNAVMQTSLNPLVTNLIAGDKLSSVLTFGQFVKAIASFLAPILAAWGAVTCLPTFGLGWRALFLVYFIIGLAAAAMLAVTSIKDEEPAGRSSSFADCLRLLTKPVVLFSFIGIMCHVGIDVGTNTTAPKVLMERLGITLNEAAFATSLYFIFRTFGCLSGSFLLRFMSNRLFFAISVIMMTFGMAGMAFGTSQTMLYAAIALIGFGNSNVFSLIFSQALLSVPDKKNEISGLMIMGLFGGTVFPLLMGFASDAAGQVGAVAVMAIGTIYLISYINKIKYTV